MLSVDFKHVSNIRKRRFRAIISQNQI